MTDQPAAEMLKLELRRTFDAPREKVFAAWTQSEQMSKWFRTPEAENFVAEADLRVGGRFRIGVKNRETGEEHIANGTYREFKPPEKLVFTWLWEGQNPDTHTTLVTLDFRVAGESGEKTDLILKHERFPDQNMCDQHRQGWEGCFTNLEKLF